VRDRFDAAGFAAADRPAAARALRRSSCSLIFSTRASAFWLRSPAFSSESHSTPLCSLKPASSEAITARFRFALMRS